MRDRRSTDERAKRSGIKIEKNWAKNGALWKSAGKYADDSSLLVAEKCDIEISEELENIHKWADENKNKLKINLAKTKELVFHRLNVRNYLAPSELPGLEQILCAKLLGVWLQHDVGMRSTLTMYCT